MEEERGWKVNHPRNTPRTRTLPSPSLPLSPSSEDSEEAANTGSNGHGDFLEDID